MASGLPYSVTTVTSMFGGSGVDLIDPSLFDTKGGRSLGNPALAPVVTFGSKYVQVPDPQCNGGFGGYCFLLSKRYKS